ncbi:class I SAM-dependent methyltransferase [Streptomyces canarius]
MSGSDGARPVTALDAEQTLHLLDHLTWCHDHQDASDPWPAAARHISERLTDRPPPAPDACRTAAERFGATGTATGDRDTAALYRAKYDLMVRLHPAEWLTFMNMGYTDEGERRVGAGDPATGLGSAPARLYELVARQSGLAGTDVLDLGSGRGGGTALLAREPGVRSVVGVDFSHAGVAFSRRVHPGRLRFVCADAALLPFPDGSFNRVVSVESAHCFAGPARCFAEVRRVLRPGGRLVLADEWPAGRVADLTALLAQAGLRVTDLADITAGVLRSLDRLPSEVARWLAGRSDSAHTRAYERFFRDRIGGDSAGLYRSGRYAYVRVTAVRDR